MAPTSPCWPRRAGLLLRLGSPAPPQRWLLTACQALNGLLHGILKIDGEMNLVPSVFLSSLLASLGKTKGKKTPNMPHTNNPLNVSAKRCKYL